MSCSPTTDDVVFLQGIRDFRAGQPSGTGMGRTLQRALQFAEDSNYDSVFEELRTVCTP